MKVIAFNGSARKDGNTAVMIRRVLEVLKEEGIETELIQLAGERIFGCRACGTCVKNKNKQCINEDDKINAYIRKVIDADGLILGSPVYFSMVTPELKALIDRVGYVSRANGDLLKGKVGAAVVAVRRAGAMTTFDAINHFFLISQMIVPGSSYWNVGIGGKKGDVSFDKEGMETMETLGRNMAWLIKKIKS